jgi:type I restriction enzyme S subunit
MAQELYELPQGWEWKELNSICEKTEYIAPNKTPSVQFNYVDISAIDREKHIIAEVKEILGKDAPSRAKKEIKPNDILFATTRPNLKNIAIYDTYLERPVASTGFCILRCKQGTSHNYIFRFLITDHLQNQISDFISGAQYPAITDKNLKRSKIPVPPLAEQERIVAKLDALFSRIDQAIAQLQHTQAQTKALFASALDAALLDPEEKHKTYTFDEICSIKSKLVDPRTTSNLEMLHVGGANIETLTGQLSSLQTAAQEKLISGKHYFDSNTVLYSKIRPYLRKVARPDFEGLCSADIYPLTPVPETLLRDYLFYILISEHFTQYAISGSNRAGMPKVNRNHLFSYPVNLPPLAEQSKIVAQLDAISERTQALTAATSAQLEKLRALKASLLDAAFRGQLPSDQ